MKKIIAVVLCLVMIFSFAIPSFGATSVTIDESGVFSPNQSNTNYSTNTVFTNLNILEAIRVLADSSAYDIHTLKNLFTTGSYKTVADAFNLYFNGSASDISSYGNENLYLMQSAFYFLGREIQGMNYFTPYSGGQATSLDEALNKNLLYIQNQLQVISDSMASHSASSGLMSGWGSNGVSAPEGYDTSWYRRMLMNLYSFRLDLARLHDGTWADSTIYSDSFFYQTFLQNKIVSDNVSNLVTGWNKGDLITSPGEYSESWYYWVFDNLNGMLENSELFEDIYLERNNFEYLDFITQGLTYNVKYNGTFSDSVTNSLSSIGQALTFKLSTSFDNPFSSNGKTSVNTSYGSLNNMLQHMNHQSGFLARLAYVLADDEEIRLNETIQDSKTEVVDFVGEGVTSSSGSSFSIMSGLTDGIEFSSNFFEFFDMSVSLDDVWYIFDNPEVFSWFTDETAMNIDTVSSTYSRDINPQTEIVTSYYEDRQAEFAEKWGALIG